MKEYRTIPVYRTLVQSSLLNSIGTSLFNLVFVIYASTLPFKEIAVTLASLAMLLPSLSQLFIGYCADRTCNKAKASILARLTQALLFLSLAYLITLTPSIGLFLILLGINVASDCLGIYSGSVMLPIIKQVVPESSLSSAMSFQFSLNTLVQIVFQGAAALAIVWLHYQFSLFGLMNAITFLLSGVLVWRHHKAINSFDATTQAIEQEKIGSWWVHTKETLTLLKQEAFLMYILILAIAVNTLGTSIDGLMNLTLLNEKLLWFGNYGNTIALLGMSISIGMIGGSMLSQDIFKRSSMFGLITWLMLISAFIPLSLLFFPNKFILLCLFFSLGYLIGKFNPKLSAYLIERTPANKLAMMSGVFSMIVMLGGPIGQFILLGLGNLYTPYLSWVVYLVASLGVILLSRYFNYRQSQA